MILILGIAAGFLTGLIRSSITGKPYHVPELSQVWLVLVAVIPQLLIFQISYTAGWFSDTAAAGVQVISQLLLLVFIWFNRDRIGIRILGLGLLLNLLVITLNGGLMPVAPETAAALFPDVSLSSWEIGARPGRSKNILLRPEDTRLAWLSDAILLPAWFPWTRALSPGDLFIVLGVIWLLALESSDHPAPPKITSKTEKTA
jgi:hypothetical protein